MSDDEPLSVDCDIHGKGMAAVVCRHLCGENDAPVGFIENSAVPGDRQAWCHGCEELFEEEGEMTPAFMAFNDMALVCEACYELIRARHEISH